MVTTSSILHEAMVADRQREMRDKAAHHRCLLDAEAAIERPGVSVRLAGLVAAVVAGLQPRRRQRDTAVPATDLDGAMPAFNADAKV